MCRRAAAAAHLAPTEPMTRSLHASLALFLAATTAGCLSHTRSDPDAGALPDSGAIGDASHCVCTDASDAGADPCSDDARGQGDCRAILGYAFSGGSCWPVTGCECVGSECGSLSATPEACIAAHVSCPRVCGGFAEAAGCLPTELCDYPDGSFCGGDDSTGVCVPRPTDCPDPGGVTVCGCDRNEYIGECSAYLAGVDVARIGPCVTTSAYRTAMAEPDCAPADGPAWTFTLTPSRSSCDEVRTDGSISISVWHSLESAAPETTYSLGTDFSGDGQATICGAPGEPCAIATGTIVFHVFAAGEVARFDYDLRTTDGRRFAETNIEVASFWCRLGFIGCG